MGLSVGNDMVLSYNTDTDASPAWLEIEMVGDVTLNMSINEAEVDLRVSNWLMNLASKKTASIDFTLANNVGGTDWDTLQGYAFNRTVKQFAVANDAIATSGTEYFKAFCFISSFPWAQPTQEMSSHDCSLSLAYHEESGSMVEPSWEVTS